MVLFVLFLIPLAYAQNVTSSFNRNLLCTNPAAATTRGYKEISISQTFKSVNTDMKSEDLVDTTKYGEKVQLLTTELRYTGGHSKTVPEIYIGFNKGTKENKTSFSSDKTETDLTFVDNFINIGRSLTPKFSVGIRGYFPSFGFESETPGRTQDGTSFTSKYELDQKITGATFGVIYELVKGFFVGSFANFDTEKRKSTFTYLDFDNNSTFSESDSDSESFRRYGVGFSIVRGSSRRRGFRFETAYSTMNVSKYERLGDLGVDRAEELKTALEFAWRGLTFGGNIRMIKAGYFDQSDYVQRYYIEEPTSKEYTQILGGFLSFNSERGHSVGFSGYVLPSKGKRKLNGRDMKSEAKTAVFNINYSYLF